MNTSSTTGGGAYFGPGVHIQIGALPPRGWTDEQVRAALAKAQKEAQAHMVQTLNQVGARLTDREFRNFVKIAARVADTQPDPIAFALRWVEENRAAVVDDGQ